MQGEEPRDRGNFMSKRQTEPLRREVESRVHRGPLVGERAARVEGATL